MSNTGLNKSAETVQQPIIDRWREEILHQVFLCKSLHWMDVFMMHSAL